MKVDSHVHSEFSDDSFYPMEDVVLDAIERGIDEITFTDHVDYGVKTDFDLDIYKKAGREDLNTWITRPNIGTLYNVNYPHYFATIDELRKKYGDRIRIHAGLEFGMQKETLPLFEALYDTWKDRLDFILLSVHQLKNQEFWTGQYQEDHDQDAFYREYYEELLWLVRHFPHYDSLAHLDLISRYDTYPDTYDFEKVRDLVEEILKTVIEQGKGIEINTSSIRYRVGDTTPSREILQMYRDLGGKIITIGSDSHRPEHLGEALEEQMEILKDIGFEGVTVYENQKPVFHAF